jgi:hypothetical protein
VNSVACHSNAGYVFAKEYGHHCTYRHFCIFDECGHELEDPSPKKKPGEGSSGMCVQTCLPDLNSQMEGIPFLGICIHLLLVREGKGLSRADDAEHSQALAKVAAFLAIPHRYLSCYARQQEFERGIQSFVKLCKKNRLHFRMLSA